MKQPRFLPMSGKEAAALGWSCLDVLLISGDAYVDHPSFGVALLGRYLVSLGLRVGIVAQPSWENREHAIEQLTSMGRPRLFAGVTAGAIDSMLAHYTAFRKKRSDDAYTPGGRTGARPNRAVVVYTGLVRQAFPGIPVIIGGLEASLRRVSHYDFWTDSLRRSILLDSKADLLVYGMGENALAEISVKAAELASGFDNDDIFLGGRNSPDRHELVRVCKDISGIAWSGASGKSTSVYPAVHLPSHEELLGDASLLMKATLALEEQVHQGTERLVQISGDRFVAVNPPALALSEQELDALYGLPFSRLPHPAYTEPVPAWEMVRTSITTHRGCGGGCSFCSLALHQGRRIASRGERSILTEARTIAAGSGQGGSGAIKKEKQTPPRWAGSISDVGGPSANMWQAQCALPEGKKCSRASCLHPAICPFFEVDQKKGVRLLRNVAAQKGVRNVRVASGVRFDLALRDREALRAYTAEFTGGQLKVAPEHSEDAVLKLMRKPSLRVFEDFLEVFAREAGKAGKELYTVPYLISSFPGCTDADMRQLSNWLHKRGWSPRQVQCFIPTPGTVATAMFYGGIDPEGRAIHVARTDSERLRQHGLLLGETHPSRERRKQRSR